MDLAAVRLRNAWATVVTLSLAAVGLLVWIIFLKPQPEGSENFLTFLPLLNCCLNAASTICLIAGYRAIKRQKVEVHMRWMLAAFASSTLFLVSYILHHHLHGDTPFPKENSMRPLYLAVLASHILLSVIGLPMILMTFFLALSQRLAGHRRLARFTFPIWLYVSVTGVLIFAMLEAAGA